MTDCCKKDIAGDEMKIGNLELGNIPAVIGTVAGDINLPVEEVNKIDMLELRIDTFKSQDIAYIAGVVKSLKDVYGKPLLATVRAMDEGGAVYIADEKRYSIYKEVIPLVDAIDVELRSPELLKRVLPLCKGNSRLLIASYHNHDGMPDDVFLDGLISEGKGYGADIVKIAVTANSKEDLSRLISFTIKNRDKGIITISQGSIGTISRIVAPILGSLMTYGYIDKPSASGQLSAFDIAEYIRLFDPEYKGSKEQGARSKEQGAGANGVRPIGCLWKG